MRISLFIVLLASPNYRDRETASVALERLLPHSLPFLESASRCKDPEVSRRASLIVGRYYQRTAKVKAARVRASGYDKTPWIDMLPPEYPDRSATIQHYLGRVWETGNRLGPAEDWRDYRQATRLFLEELYASPRGAESVPSLVERMKRVEYDWIKQNHKRYKLPLPPAIGPVY